VVVECGSRGRGLSLPLHLSYVLKSRIFSEFRPVLTVCVPCMYIGSTTTTGYSIIVHSAVGARRLILSEALSVCLCFQTHIPYHHIGYTSTYLRQRLHTHAHACMAERRKRGRPRTEARLDNWFGVEDARERKRIQDRLAQRARSKFLVWSLLPAFCGLLYPAWSGLVWAAFQTTPSQLRAGGV
jgi:hypothetical protein